MTTIIKLGDKVSVENRFKPLFIGIVIELHWHAFGGAGLVVNGKKEHKAKSVELAGGEIWYRKPTFAEFINWLDKLD